MAGYLLTKRNDVPLLVGSNVTFDNQPAYIKHMDEKTGWVYIKQKGHVYRIYPSSIGAKWFL